jgi:hypothetical protein
MTDKTKYRIKIVNTGDRKVLAIKNVTVSNTDELRGEIENFCMELERKYPCAVRCESVEEIKEDKPT